MSAAEVDVPGAAEQLGVLLERCTFPAPGTPLRCGVSGGPDSLALLVLACASGCAVTVVHVDHGLRAGSATEADVVATAAARFGASFEARTVQVAPGPNLEARARRARHEQLGPEAATGHTMDDQAETVLINLLRGAGVDGLAAMRHGPRHPMLRVRRAEAAALCRSLRLEPVRDPTNGDRRFVRTRVREELLPLCNAIAGRDLVPVLARQAEVLAGEAELLDALAAPLDAADAAALRAAPEALARRATRAWLREGEQYPPDLAAVARVLAVARGERRATDVAPGRRVRRSKGRLAVESVPDGSGSVGAR
ncbi:MAG TPA: tRNA lysidine(34) synthetase TilS [Acidimicrobiales bacterium]|nr:tRNA lysidine(34) synthetase TilS [Acidimicrobiales bacterium]